MRQEFITQMDTLDEDLLRMSRYVRRAMERAVEAMNTCDVVVAEQTIDADDRIDELADHVDDQCVQLLALQAPVATDLRIVITSLRVSQTLERMGDLARHVAQIVRQSHPSKPAPEPIQQKIDQMAKLVVQAAHNVVDALTDKDIKLAGKIQDQDDAIDDLEIEINKLVLDESIELSRQQIANILLLARFFERFGDHATSVARRLAFQSQGIAVAHAHDFPAEGNETGSW